MTTTLRPFNINHYVRVKFTPPTLKLWRDRAEKMRKLPYGECLFPLEPPLDEDGFYRDQFWEVMHLVAPELVVGGSAFEEFYLEIDEPEPSSVTEAPSIETAMLKVENEQLRAALHDAVHALGRIDNLVSRAARECGTVVAEVERERNAATMAAMKVLARSAEK